MLILGRKTNEAIKINDDIEIVVLGIEGDQVKLGIEAPKSVDIHRKEIYVEIQNENSQASQTPVHLLDLLNENFSE